MEIARGEHSPFDTALITLVMIEQANDGTVLSITMAGSSGIESYDAKMLEQAKRLFAKGPLGSPPNTATRSLWAFETHFIVTPPTVLDPFSKEPAVGPKGGKSGGTKMPGMELGTGQVSLGGFALDANMRPQELAHPLKQTVRSKVTLVALYSVPAADAGTADSGS
jgi:hypothetical protein